MLSDQLDETKAELLMEKNKCRLLEESSGIAREKRGAGGVARGSAEQMATLEMKALNATQRAELASVR